MKKIFSFSSFQLVTILAMGDLTSLSSFKFSKFTLQLEDFSLHNLFGKLLNTSVQIPLWRHGNISQVGWLEKGKKKETLRLCGEDLIRFSAFRMLEKGFYEMAERCKRYGKENQDFVQRRVLGWVYLDFGVEKVKSQRGLEFIYL